MDLTASLLTNVLESWREVNHKRILTFPKLGYS
jgi:hypothetical protein